MPTKQVIGGLIVAAAAGTAFWFWQRDGAIEHAAVLTAPPAPAEKSTPPAPAIASPPERDFHGVSFERGLLSVEVSGERLGPLLLDIGRRSATTIFSSPAIDERIVTIRLHEVPLEQGLRSLLGDSDVFAYSASGRLRTLWAYEPGGGAGLVPIPPEHWASTAEFERKLSSASVSERILAIETIVARNGTNALDTVNRALSDENAEVRLRALDVGLSAGVPIPPETLNMLTSDASAPVRALALEAIVSGTERGGTREAETLQLIHRMLADPDSEVRGRAQEMLDERKAT